MELWGFIPPEHIGRLYRLTDADHDYFVDGSPVIYSGTSQKILLIGSRRGGSSYVALDITDYTAPRYLYTISPKVSGPLQPRHCNARAILGPSGEGNNRHWGDHHLDRMRC